MQLKGKVALVTGGSQGIGKAIALKLGGHGASVALTYCHNKEKGEQTVEALRRKGFPGFLVKMELPDGQEIENAVTKIYKEFGSIDILVNNAGTSGKMAPVVDTSSEEWAKLLQINLNSVFLLCRTVLPKMIQKGYGRIINISSIAYRKNTPGTASYNVSKAGVNALTKTLSKEVGQFGITVNAIAPGLVLTDRIQNVRLPGLADLNKISPEEIKGKMVSETDTRRLTTEEDIAELALFLASDASKNITGEVIDISGGY